MIGQDKIKILFDSYHLYHLPQFEPLIDLLKDDQKRSRIARNGNRTFKKDFAEKKVVAQYLNFFESITSEFDSGNDEISNTDKKQS